MAYTYGSEGNCKLYNGDTSSYYKCRLGWQLNSQNASARTSSVTLRLEVISRSSSYTTSNTQTSTIDGTKLASAKFDMSSTNSWQLFGSRTITIQHGTDGTWSGTKSASFTTDATTSSYSLKSGSCSVTFTLPAISVTAQITSCPDSWNLGDSITVSWSNPSGVPTQLGVYNTAGNTAYAAYRTVTGTSYTLSFTDAELDTLYKAMGTGNSLSVRVFLSSNNNATRVYHDATVKLTGNQKTTRVNVSNSWHRGKIWVNVSGSWHRGVIWTNVNGTWHRGC